MDLRHLKTYYGPNPFSPRPVVVVAFARPARPKWQRQDLSVLAGYLQADPFNVIDGEDHVDPARAVLDLTRYLLGRLGGKIGDYAITNDGPGSAFVVGFFSPDASLAAVEASIAILTNFLRRTPEEVRRIAEKFIKFHAGAHPDYQANILIDYARKRDIPFFRFAEQTRFWQFGWGARSKIFLESLSNDDGAAAFLLQSDKTRSKLAFKALGLPTPDHVLVREADDLPVAIKHVGFPCVVKPSDQGGGKGVTADVQDMVELAEAFRVAKKYTKAPVLIEQRIGGDEHRIMVVDGDFVCAIRRRPSEVIGDGRNRIIDLIEHLNSGRNADPASGELGPIRMDDALDRRLQKYGYSLETVLPDGHVLALRSVSNLSMGGVATDVTAHTNPEVRAMAEHMARTVGLGAVGFDYITSDISQPPAATGGAFIEMNTTPGLDICLTCGFPIERVLDPMFGKQVGRIPVRLFICPTELGFGSIPEVPRPGHAVVSGDSFLLDSTGYHIGRFSDWGAAKAALRHRDTRSVDIYATPGEIVTKGLPVDRMTEIVLADKRLPQQWMPILERHANAVVTSCETFK